MAGDFVSVIKPTTKSPDEPEIAGAKQPDPVLPVRDTGTFSACGTAADGGAGEFDPADPVSGEEKTILVVAQRTRARIRRRRPICTTWDAGDGAQVVKMPNQSLFVFTEATSGCGWRVCPDHAV